MPDEQDEKLNKLLGQYGSIAERSKLAKELDDARLQMAAPHSREAKEELERRRHEQLVSSAPHRISEERELEQKFRILHSPAQMQRDFDRWVSEAARIVDYSVGVIFLDVDDFKQFNTTFTESVVDSTLFLDLQQIVAQLCMQRGAAYRYGGEELLILLPNCSLSEAAAFAHKIRRRIEENTFHVQEQTVKMTVSVGVATWPVHGDTLKMVTERANREERTAKEQGKNRVSVAP
jgi:diguanylate cyclase (GGDEF)-like protein